MFDLEQEILRCWQITEDLRKLYGDNEFSALDTVLDYYDIRFELLFQTLEAVVKEQHKPVGE
jgi:hypothetical protein